MTSLKNMVFYILVLALVPAELSYAEDAKIRHYKYAELVVVNRFYDEASGIAEMSTTVYLNVCRTKNPAD